MGIVIITDKNVLIIIVLKGDESRANVVLIIAVNIIFARFKSPLEVIVLNMLTNVKPLVVAAKGLVRIVSIVLITAENVIHIHAGQRY
jgi:hypothetical protein